MLMSVIFEGILENNVVHIHLACTCELRFWFVVGRLRVLADTADLYLMG